MGVTELPDCRRALLTEIKVSNVILKRLKAVVESSGTYRKHAFYESASYLSLQLAQSLERQWVAVEALLEELPE
jgi:hypothetical protein